ncbi:MAG TPA: hypothetical protein VKU85_07365, partial [bacterium]|nr:hypothetical protein [bacterium]
MLRSRWFTAAVLALLTTALGAAAAIATGPPGGTIYVDDMAFRTVATPRDLPDRGRFDAIYVLGGELASVAEAKPGDQDYNGGRWEV